MCAAKATDGILNLPSGVDFYRIPVFWIMAVYIPAKFRKGTSTGGCVIEFCKKKFKVAVLHHLELLLGTLDHPRSLLVDGKTVIFFFLGGGDPYTLICIIETPKRHFLW